MKNLVKFARKGLCLAMLSALCCAFTISAIDLEIKNVKGVEYYFYKVKKGDTLYGMSKSFGIPQQDMIRYNPKLSDGVKAGMKLYFPVSDFTNASAPDSLSGTIDNDNFTVAFKDGNGDITYQETIEEISGAALRMKPVTAQSERISGPVEMKVGVVLPFMLNEEKADRAATYATDFYKGFLLGIDSLRASYGNPSIKVVAVDCGNDKTPFSNVVANNPLLKEVDLIIAPDMATMVNSLGGFGQENSIYIFNAFQPRDTTYLVNPYMMQGNIPTSNMYDKAIGYFIDNIDGATIIFLENNKSKKNKKEFVDALQSELDKKGIEYNTMSYEDTLAPTAISSKLDTGDAKYIFVPLDASVDEFNKFSAALTNLKSKFTETDKGGMWLFGYPEYIAYKGTALDRIKKLNTRYYSRFITDMKMPEVKAINDTYKRIYGSNLPVGVPNQALYGFDIAKWIISLAARNNVRDNLVEIKEEKGTQTSYRFVPTQNGGLVNDAIIIVKLSPDSDTQIEIL